MKLAKQIIDFNKATFDNSFNAMVLVQEQMEKAQSTFLDQVAWFPEKARKHHRLPPSMDYFPMCVR